MGGAAVRGERGRGGERRSDGKIEMGERGRERPKTEKEREGGERGKRER